MDAVAGDRDRAMLRRQPGAGRDALKMDGDPVRLLFEGNAAPAGDQMIGASAADKGLGQHPL